jgi:hypothetical protein
LFFRLKEKQDDEKKNYKSYNFNIRRLNIDNKKNMAELLAFFTKEFIDSKFNLNDERQIYLFHSNQPGEIKINFVDEGKTAKQILREAKLYFLND